MLPKRSTLASYRRRKEIGAALQTVREACGLTRMEAAVLADVTFHTWERWEMGKTAIPLDRVADIRRALKGRNPFPTTSKFLVAA